MLLEGIPGSIRTRSDFILSQESSNVQNTHIELQGKDSYPAVTYFQSYQTVYLSMTFHDIPAVIVRMILLLSVSGNA